MEDLRLQKLELKVNNHNRRLDDHDEDIEKYGKDIAMLQKILTETEKTNRLISEVVDYAKKTYEVFEPMSRFMTKVAKVGLIFTFFWHGIKYLAFKMGFLT